MKIGLAAGHTRNAANNNFRLREFSICHATAKRLHWLLTAAGYDVTTPKNTVYDAENNEALRAKVDLFNTAGVELAIELHLNGGRGRYSTAIYWGNAQTRSESGYALAGHIARSYASGLDWKSIGARQQSYFGRSLYFLNETAMPSVIVEPGFLDNFDHALALDNYEGVTRYATLTFSGIARYLDSMSADPQLRHPGNTFQQVSPPELS